MTTHASSPRIEALAAYGSRVMDVGSRLRSKVGSSQRMLGDLPTYLLGGLASGVPIPLGSAPGRSNVKRANIRSRSLISTIVLIRAL